MPEDESLPPNKRIDPSVSDATKSNMYMNKEKNLSPSQGLNLGLLNTSQMLLPLRHHVRKIAQIH